MTLSEHVDITITQDSLGVSRAGFGVPLILSHNAAFTERVRSYSSLLEVAADFADTSPEYLAASAMFSQSPHPKKIKIGRAANVPTQLYTLNVTTVRNSHTYQIQVEGEGVTSTLVEFTSDASATNGEIVIGLVAALNGVSGKNFTAAGATSPFTVTGDAAGDYFSLEILDVTDLNIAQNHTDPGVAADLTAIALEDDDWYALYTLYNSKAYVGAAATWISSQRKIYIPDTNVTDAITLTRDSSDDVLEDLYDLTYPRVAGVWHHQPYRMAGAAWLGRVLPAEPGGITWKWKTLTGLPSSNLTTTQRTNLRDRKANFYQSVAGVNIMVEGTTADGDFIDVQRGEDWLDDDMKKSIFEALAGTDKVPFDNDGIAVVQNEVESSLERAVDRGILRSSPAPVVEVPDISEVSSADLIARTLSNVKFEAKRSQAIHKVTLTGVVSV